MDYFEKTNFDENKFSQLKEKTNFKFEIIDDVPIFTIGADQQENFVFEIIKLFGENIFCRIINANFIDDAIFFGTDKISLDAENGKHDFRQFGIASGRDWWNLEEKAQKSGLKKSDVFCASSLKIFTEDKINSAGIGIPKDRAAILIYDGKKIQQMEKISDGFFFKNPENKKDALLGIVKFAEILLDFEKNLRAEKNIDQKILLIEKEIFENLNTINDLPTAFYISLNIIELIYKESVENEINFSEKSVARIEKLTKIKKNLKRTISIIDFSNNMQNQINIARKSFAEKDSTRMHFQKKWPDFVIAEISEKLENPKLEKKWKIIFEKIIADAEKCKTEFGI